VQRSRRMLPRLVARDHGDEIGIENRGDDHRGIAGVGEVVMAHAQASRGVTVLAREWCMVFS